MTDLLCELVRGDCRKVLPELGDELFDAVVCDPPYGLSKEPDMAEVLGHWLAGDDYESSGGGFMGKCLHPDTDILVDGGWKPVALVGEGDRVCSLNPDTGQIEYVEVTSVHEYPFDGDLLEVGGRSTRQVVTPNHNVWTDRGLIRADQLPCKFRLYNQGSWRQDWVDILEIEGATFPAAALLRFFGLWLGDGYVVHRQAQPWKQDFIGFTVKKSREAEAIRGACEALGVRYTENRRGDWATFYVYDKALLAWLSPLGGSHSKSIPSWLFTWCGSELLEHLYQGMMDTDGARQGSKGQHVYYTVSDALADDFQRLCLHTGRSAVKTWRDRSTNFGGEGCWTLSVVQARPGFWMERDGRLDRPQPAAVRPFPYRGRVHCVTLERNHVMMSRWQGRTVWTGNSWDSFVPGPATWKAVFDALKPGGHLVCFTGTRTFDLMGIALRLAGFEVRDTLMWVYGQGFPKSMDVSKAIDKAAGAERTPRGGEGDHEGNVDFGMKNRCPKCDKPYFSANPCVCPREDLVAVTSEAQEWSGWGTALKPAWEPIILARKPLRVDGKKATVAQNVLVHRTGGLNIDGCRIAANGDNLGGGAESKTSSDQKGNEGWVRPWMDDPDAQADHAERVRANVEKAEALGRFPANMILTHHPECVRVGTKTVESNGHYPSARPGTTTITTDGHRGQDGLEESYTSGEEVEDWECVPDCPVALLDGQSGVSSSTGGFTPGSTGTMGTRTGRYGAASGEVSDRTMTGFGDRGGASRFFYCAKASKSERNEGLPEGLTNIHPTCKPVNLMAYLVRLVTRPGGLVLDPFCGSGSTGVACQAEGMGFVGIDRDDEPGHEGEYLTIARHRLGLTEEAVTA